jgi:mannose-6-phosphate isomerase
VRVRRLEAKALDKIWGTPDTEPWYARSSRKIGEVWFTAPEEPRLLLKFIFTAEKLSVQVHPPDSPSGAPGKTEMWHILRARPDASLALGFHEVLERERARQSALSGEIESLLHWYPVHVGETFFVPARTVHAIGGGLALCEIQQYSDITYRLYDYGRPRELHLDQGLAVADLGPHAGPSCPIDLGGGRRLLVECPYFRTESLTLTGAAVHRVGPHAEYLVCIQGVGQIDGQPFAPGNVWVTGAGVDAIPIVPTATTCLLRTFVP